jgi:hypothetical protein
MILTREITIKINSSNFQYFDDLGYDISIGEELTIPVELLSKGSHYKITCKCDGCGVVKDVIFKNYVKYDNKWLEYYCRKCSEKKRKETLIENYGVEYPIQNTEIFTKIRKRISERNAIPSTN